jgi:hypothetical protein
MSTRRTQTKSDSPVAAREALDQAQAPGGDREKVLADQAKAQERQQRQELGGSLSGAGAKADEKLQKQGSAFAAVR